MPGSWPHRCIRPRARCARRSELAPSQGTGNGVTQGAHHGRSQRSARRARDHRSRAPRHRLHLHRRPAVASGGLLVFRRHPPEQAVAHDARQGARGGQERHARRQRHDLRPAGPPDPVRRRRPPRHAHGRRRQGGNAGRQLQGRALQPPQRRDLPFQRLPLFHRSGQAPPLSRARDPGPRRRRQSVGRRSRLPRGPRRQP